MMSRTTFKDHFLNAVALALQSPSDASVERRSFWKRPNLPAKERAPLILPPSQIGLSVQIFKRRIPRQCHRGKPHFQQIA